MDSNWQKLLAKKQKAGSSGAPVRKRRFSATSANGDAERPSQRAKQGAPVRKSAFQGFVPKPVSAAEYVPSVASGLKPVTGALTSVIALDCEMVGVGNKGEEERSVIARVSIVNFNGQVVYDTYVKPGEKVSNYRTAVSGILPQHLSGPGAIPFERVNKEVSEILKDRILVGHAVHHDLKVLMIGHPRNLTRDTSRYKPFCPFGPKSLKRLCQEILKLEIQSGEHCSVEDARSTLALYKHAAATWEPSLRRKALKKAKRMESAEDEEKSEESKKEKDQKEKKEKKKDGSSKAPPSKPRSAEAGASKKPQARGKPSQPRVPAADAVHPFA